MTESPNRGQHVVGSVSSADGVGVVRVQARFDTDIIDLWSALTVPPGSPSGTAGSMVSCVRGDGSERTSKPPTSRAQDAWRHASSRGGSS